MRRATILSIVVGSVLVVAPQRVWADAAGDLSAGQAALGRGEVEKAVPLLESAAQALPRSVEAQLALARAYLQAGQLDKALTQYRVVAKLSPAHAEAKRMVEVLTGRRKTFDQKLAYARALLDAGLYSHVMAEARPLMAGPYEPAQRLAGRMLLAEAKVLSGFSEAQLVEALKALAEAKGTPSEGPARVLAAMAMAASKDPTTRAAAAAMLKVAGEAPNPFKQWAELMNLVLRLDEKSAADVSAKLAGPLSAVPQSNYRVGLLGRLVDDLTALARQRAGRGEEPEGLRILWPMATAAGFPADIAARGALIGQPVDTSGGWLSGSTQSRLQGRLLDALIAVANNGFIAKGSAANLAPAWLAAEYLRQLPAHLDSTWSVDQRIRLAETLAGMSRPPVDRRKGAPLSRADRIQRMVLMQLAGELTKAQQQTRLVTALIGQMGRYQQAGDVEAALGAFVTIKWFAAAAGPPAVTVLPSDLPAGPARRKWVSYLADRYAELGAKAFAEAARSAGPDANVRLNAADRTALALYGLLLPEARRGERFKQAEAIANRYAGAEKWSAAMVAVELFYAGFKGDAGKWASARMKARQSASLQDKQLLAHHRLGAKLDPLAAEALADAVAIVRADPSDVNKAAAVTLASPFVSRYRQLERLDLAEAVIAVMTPAGVDALADWALIARANLLDSQASGPLALAAKQFEGAKKLKLNARHAAELKLLGELIEKFPASKYVPSAVERVIRVAKVYQGYKAFDVGAQVLADFVKAHPKMAAAERLEYVRIEVLLAKAQGAFADRPDKDKPPVKLSDEYAAGIGELAAFLKAHPTGLYSPGAENQLFAIARTYGQVGAWAISREVLGRFAAAVPDFRSPARLRLAEAATYLGELDRSHGLALLKAPSPPAVAWWKDRWSGEEEGGWGNRLGDGKGGEGVMFGLDASDYTRDDAGATLTLSLLGSGERSSGTATPQPVRPPSPSRKPANGGAARPVQPTAESTSGPMNQSANRLAGELHDVPGESLAMIRQAERQQSRRIALLRGGLAARRGQVAGAQGAQQAAQQQITLPAGPVLSEDEMKRQDAAADAAYAILIELARQKAAEAMGRQARGEIMWLIGFFEGQLRANRAVVLIERFLKDRPTDEARVALAYQAISDRLVWSAQRQPTDKINQGWVDARHKLFEEARQAIEAFVKEYSEQKKWASRGLLLAVGSYEQEAGLVAIVSAPRAAGLLARSADELLGLADSEPDHPDVAGFPSRLWGIADRLAKTGQRDQAIYVFSRLPIRFPLDNLARQAVLRIAQLYAQNLSAPLRAVETYQEYLALAGDNNSIRSQIFAIAQQLAGKQRYLEALHVYGVFVDSFPTDARASQALLAIGRTHQANEAWAEAMKAYQRILDEYAGNTLVKQVKLAMAECEIQLSQWRAARKIYEDYIRQYPGTAKLSASANAPDAQSKQSPGSRGATIQERIEVLKSLDRYQMLLADKEVTRNKDDAQFQIGRIVLDRLGNRIKAMEEFGKVVAGYPRSDQADDAQYEIGRALLALNRLDEARAELLKVPMNYPTSPLSDDALYQVGQSYERQAQRLAAVTLAKARDIAFEAGQRGAYKYFQKQQDVQFRANRSRRKELKAAGKGKQLELEEAYNVFRYNPNGNPDLGNIARQAEQQAETESALEVANRQDRINEAYRQAVTVYGKAARDFPLGDRTDESLLRMAEIFETRLKDRKAAMETYQRVVKFFPGTPVAESAAWKVAKFYEQEGNYDEAVKAYRNFIRNYPASSRVADAQYAMAEALEQLGRWVEAMDAYQTFRDKFAKHPKAQPAAEQIQWIKAYRK